MIARQLLRVSQSYQIRNSQIRRLVSGLDVSGSFLGIARRRVYHVRSSIVTAGNRQELGASFSYTFTKGL